LKHLIFNEFLLMASVLLQASNRNQIQRKEIGVLPMKTLNRLFTLGLLLAALPSANATIIDGLVTSGSGSFVKLSPGFTDSDPDNTVGNNTFQNTNLYGFDEDQNTTVVGTPLDVDILASTGLPGTLAVDTVVASHYVFFDPAGSASQTGWVDFDSDILAVITSTGNLLGSDYLANTGVIYLNPGLRGLESGDSATIDGSDPRRLNVSWTASTPGDYVRVLTEFSPGAVIPSPASLALLGIGLVALGFSRRKLKTGKHL
jgi:hypothetical protein